MRELFLQNRVIILLLSLLVGATFLLLFPGERPEAASLFDWDVNDWPDGSLMQTYSGIGSPATVFTYTFSGDTDRIQQGRPRTTDTDITGGITPPEDTLYISADFDTYTDTITLTIDLSREVFNASFLLLDVDDPTLGLGIDRVEIVGKDTLGGTVIPTLTPLGFCVSVNGNVATGTCHVANNTDNANLEVSFGFQTGIEQIVIVYSEGSQNPDPEPHGIALHDIYFEPDFPVSTPTPTPTATPTSTPPPAGSRLYLPAVLKQ